MPATNEVYVKGQTDLSAAATYVSATAPSLPWAAGSSLTFNDGGPVTFTNLDAIKSVNFDSIKFTPGFTSNIGDSSNYLQVWVNNAGTSILDYNAGGTIAYIEGNPAQKQINELWWRPQSQALGVFKGVEIQGSAYAAGACKFNGTSKVVDLRTSSGGNIDLDENAADTVGSIDAYGNSTVRVRRAMGGTCTIGPGATVYIDFDGSSAGTFVLAGGRLVHVRGNIIVTGNAGTYDATGLKKSSYTLSIADAPDLLELYGPTKPVITRSKTWGRGSTKQG